MIQSSLAREIAHKLINGDIGVIEGSRELSSISHQIEHGLENIFRIFIGIDSETVSLPVGGVRAEWQARALALKDIEIARCEQRYRQRTVAACRELLDRLDMQGRHLEDSQ